MLADGPAGGQAVLSAAHHPGLGFRFDESAVGKYAVDNWA